MATKIIWSGARIATLVGARARLYDAGGAPLAEPPFVAPVIEIAFDGEQLVTFDRDRRFCIHDPDGELIRQGWVTGEGPGAAASLAPRRSLVAIGGTIYDFASHVRWQFRPDEYDVHVRSPVHFALAPTGVRLAIAHATLPGEVRPPGRGWLVVPIDPDAGDALAARGPTPRNPFPVTAAPRRAVIDRSWLQTHAEPGPTLFAFDATAARMIHASPETTPHTGAIRIGKDRAYTATHPGGAHAIALDPLGVIAAYAYPDAPRRFRVDYLDPDDAETSMIDVLDSLSIDPALPDIGALAFSPDSHAIACVARSGAIEIVPVP